MWDFFNKIKDFLNIPITQIGSTQLTVWSLVYFIALLFLLFYITGKIKKWIVYNLLAKSKITILNVHEEFMTKDEMQYLRVSQQAYEDLIREHAEHSRDRIEKMIDEAGAGDFTEILLREGKPRQIITEVATEIPRCRSISIQSEVAVFLILFDFTAPAT